MSGPRTRFSHLGWTAASEAWTSRQVRLVPSCTEDVGLGGAGPSNVIDLERS